MNPEVLSLIVGRLERIESQNDEQLKLLHEHLDTDAAYYTKSDRHEIYFKALGALVLVILAAVLRLWF